jgi:hypothetical protein
MSGRGRPPIGPVIGVRLEPELLELVDSYAADVGLKRAELLRQLIAEAVARR